MAKNKRKGADDLNLIQYENIYLEDDVPLDNVRASSLRLLIYLLLPIICFFVLLGFNVKLARTVTYRFVLKGNEQERIYRFYDDFYLNQKLVKVGQPVKPGTPLLRISSPQIVGLVGAYRSAQEQQNLFSKLGSSIYEDEMRAAKLSREKARKESDEAEKEAEKVRLLYENDLKKNEFLVAEAQRNLRVEQELFDSGVSAQVALDKAKEGLVLARHNVTALKESYERELIGLRRRAEMSGLDGELTANEYAHKEKQRDSRRETLKTEVQLALDKIRHNYGNVSIERGGLVLNSDSAGQVSYLVESEKAIPSGTIILKVKGDSGALYAASKVPPDKIGMVKEGAPIVMKIDTFPHYEWGAVEGRIRVISLTPDNDGNYPFEVELTNAGRLNDRLQIGMGGELSISVEEKSFFEHLFSEIQEGYYKIIE